MNQQIHLCEAFKLIDIELGVIEVFSLKTFCLTSMKITGNLLEFDDLKFIANF
tara:strand:+ start:142 stop:300 length:159 start_codon:yes stop_codon:yes gene_type:complete